jgi:polyisoprenoid-binding protein YceI
MKILRILSFLALASGLSAAPLGAGGPGTAGRALVLDPGHSSIEVLVHATFDTFLGRLRKFQADIVIDPEQARTQRALVTFAFADLKTGRPGRDRDMLEWSENNQYPTVEFRMEALEQTPGAPAQAHGSLKIHGIEHATTFPVSFLIEGPLYAIDGEVLLDYRDFGLPVIRKFVILTVDPRLQVRFHLQGRLAPAAAPQVADFPPP